MVRPAGLDDASAIARVHVETWRTAYRGLLPDDFLQSLTHDHYTDRWRRGIGDTVSRVFVAEDESGVIGFASGGRERAGEDNYSGELYALYVADRAQHRGFGRLLVCAVVASLREMGLPDMIVWALRDNPDARAFYEHLGGAYLRTQPISIGETTLQEVAYGWRRLEDVRC